MEAVEREWQRGARVWPQVQTRPIDISWTLDQRSIMFLVIPGWWQVLSLTTREEKLAAFADPAVRDTLVGGLEHAGHARPARTSTPAASSCARPPSTATRTSSAARLDDIAAERETTPAELLVDLAVEEELGTWFIRSDIGHVDAEAVGSLLAHPYVHVGASDGGAHVGSFATYGDTGFLLSRYVRETGALRLEEAIKKITSDPATIWGLPDRGLVREGYAADLVVFDPDDHRPRAGGRLRRLPGRRHPLGPPLGRHGRRRRRTASRRGPPPRATSRALAPV